MFDIKLYDYVLRELQNNNAQLYSGIPRRFGSDLKKKFSRNQQL